MATSLTPRRKPCVSVPCDLFAVAQDLCLIAAGLLLRGHRERSARLVDQSTELLAHRGQLLTVNAPECPNPTATDHAGGEIPWRN